MAKKKAAAGGSKDETGMTGVEVILAATTVSTQDVASEDQETVQDGWIVEERDLATGTGSIETMLMGVMMMFPMVLKFLSHPNVWVGDSAASCDSTPHTQGMTNIMKTKNGIGIENGNGSLSKVQGTGELRGTVCDKSGKKLGQVKMTDVRLTPENKYNLFSISKRLKEGWKMTGDKNGMVLTKGNEQVTFDIIIPTHDGVIFAMYIERERNQQHEIAGIVTTRIMKLNIGRAHELLGHMGEDMTRKTAKHLGWQITRGTLQTCESCAIGKAKQRNVPKISDHVTSKVNGERVFLDIATIKGEKDGVTPNAKKNWRIMVDERTQMKFSLFCETKDGMVIPTLDQLVRWNKSGMHVKYIRLDNAGENKKLQKISDSKDYQMNIQFEFTARNTPQQNHLSELGFTVLINRARAMLHRANIPKHIRYKVFPKVFETATLLDGLVICTIDGVTKTRIEHFGRPVPKFANHLRTWGEAGTVTIRHKMQPKLEDRGMTCVFVGYAVDHEGDCYLMWNPTSKGVYTTRDIIWLNRFYYQKIHDVDDDDEDLLHIVATDKVDDAVEGESDAGAGIATVRREPYGAGMAIASRTDEEGSTRRSTRVRFSKDTYEAGTSGMEPYVTKDDDNENQTNEDEDQDQEDADNDETEMAAWLSEVEIDLTPAEEKFYEGMRSVNEIHELGLIGAGIGGGFVHTSELKVMKYKEAMAGPDKEQWEKAVEDEHDKFVKYGVFKAVRKEDVPKNVKVMSSTWAMKKKASGVYRARVTARGYEQVEGIHYKGDDIASPVANEMTVRIVMTLAIMAGWYCALLDVIGAFLNGRFGNNEKIYMKVPEGFERWYSEAILLLLLKAMYGTKQAAMQFWKEMQKAFMSMGYERSKADPCLYSYWFKGRLVLWMIWVDDCFIAGDKARVLQEKERMKQLFDCEDIGEMTEFVGCKVEYNLEGKYMRLTQPVMIQSFVDEFDLPTDGPIPNTPAETGQVLSKGEQGMQMPIERQKKYRSGTGKLLHMMRWSRPDVLNAVRECSKFMSGAWENHMAAMQRIMRYVVNTAARGLKLCPNAEWDGSQDFLFELEGWSDSEYAKDSSRRSVNGWSVFLNGSAIAFRSKMMPIVALSVTEAELYSAVQCAQDMLYAMRIVNSIGLKVKLPMRLIVDNKGADDLCHNWSVGGRTRHVEVKQYFLRELKEAGIIETEWRRGDEQRSDVFTKNLPRPPFEKHASNFVGVDEYMSPNHGRVSDGDRTTGSKESKNY
jgi:hypothetical protein